MSFTNPYPASRLTLDATASINSGLVAFYPLTDETSSTALDISGNSHNGTMTNGAYFTGSTGIGRCAFFDGSNDYCTTGNAALSIDGNVGSMSFWFKSNASQVGKRLFEFGSSATTGRSIGVVITSSGDVTFRYRQSSTNYNVTGPTLSSLGSGWNFAVATWDASNNINLYINGTKYTGTRSGSINVGNLDRGYIAERALEVPLGEAFNGEMQNVRCWTVELSQAQVDLLLARPWSGTDYDSLWPYSPPAPADATLSTDTAATSLNVDLEGWWLCTDNTGTTLVDISGNGRDATLYGTNTWVSDSVGTVNRFDNSLSDGNNARTANTQPDLSGGYTVAFWLNSEDAGLSGQKYGSGVSLTDGTGTGSWWSTIASDLEFYFRRDGNTQWPQLVHNRNNGGTIDAYALSESNKASQRNVWKFWVITFDGTNARIYRDASLIGTSGTLAAPLSTTGKHIVINGVADTATGLNCSMQNIRLYSRALSADEITLLYERPFEGLTYGDAFHYDPPTPANLTPLDNSSGINTGQELWLPLTDGTGTTAVDIGGNGSNGTVTGASWSDFEFGKGLSLSATNQYVQASVSSSLLSSPFTINAWVDWKSSSAYTSLFAFESNYLGGNYTNGEYVGLQRYASSTLRLHSGNGFGSNISVPSRDGEIAMVTMVCDPSSSNAQVFFNGVLAINESRSFWQSPTGNLRFLGGGNYNVTDFMNGGQNLRFWSRSLTADEIWSIYTNPWLGSAYTATPSAVFYNYILRSKRFRRLS